MRDINNEREEIESQKHEKLNAFIKIALTITKGESNGTGGFFSLLFCVCAI